MVDAILKRLYLDKINSGIFVAGKWLSSTTEIVVDNPSNNKPIATVTAASEEQMQAAIEAAVVASKVWKKIPAPKRGEVIYAIGHELRKYKSALGDLVAIETGKSKVEGDGEVQEMIDMADFAVGQSRMLYGCTMPSERVNHRMYEQWHPLGVVGVITAFNFPVAVWAWNAFLALVCGNAVVWKPSGKAPLSAIAVMRICQHVIGAMGYDLGVVSLVVTEELAAINALVDSNCVALISFTGSTAVGKSVGVKVANRMGKCLLELGGNNAAIVMPDADLRQVIPAVVFGAIGTAGQRCTSLRRLFVHQKIYQQVVKELVIAYKQIVVGNPLDAGVHMGPLIDKAAVANYLQLIDWVRQRSGKVYCGGEQLALSGNFVQPALIAAELDWEVLQVENFVPILWIVPVDNLQQAIDYNNSSEHGLSSAIFTKKISYMESFLSAVGSDCGIACINQSTSGAEIGGAFGGEKQTGGGREAGSDAWRAYMRRQTVTINYGKDVVLAQGIDFKE